LTANDIFSPGFQCCQQLDTANCCAMLCYSEFEESNGQISSEHTHSIASNH